MTQENQVNKIHLAILLGFLAALAPLATDMYLPALPTMNEEFDASTSIIQMTLTMTLVGMAIGQLFAGPISDRFGRKSPLVAGMVFFTLSTFGCIFSEDIMHFLISRFIQGLSGSFGIVIARAIARDTYKGAELTKFISLLMLVNGLAPILAPVIGGQILLFTHWRGIFVTLAVVGLLLILSSMAINETLSDEFRMKDIYSSFTIFGSLLRDKYFFGHCLIQFTIFAAFFAYIAGSPFLFQNIYHVSPQMYSFIFGGLGACMSISGLIPIRLAGRVADIKMMTWAVVQALIGSIIFMLCIILHMPIGFTIVSLIIFVSTIPVFGAASFSLSMRYHAKEAGAASAIFGFSSMFSSGLIAPLVGISGSDNAFPMALIIFIGALITVIIFYKTIFTLHHRGYLITNNMLNVFADNHKESE